MSNGDGSEPTAYGKGERRLGSPEYYDISEYSVSIALAYLKSRRLHITHETRQQVLRCVSSALAENAYGDIMTALIDQLDVQFLSNSPSAAPATPPLNRGSIGYD